MSTLMRKRVARRAGAGRRTKQRTMQRKLAKIPTPEILTKTELLTGSVGPNDPNDTDITLIGAGVGDPGRTGSQIQTQSFDWLVRLQETGSLDPIRLTIYSFKDDATAVSTNLVDDVYDENLYNVYMDKVLNPSNSGSSALFKGSMTLKKNMRYFGNNAAEHTTPPIRFRLTGPDNDGVPLTGYVRTWYLDK